ncbi:MAG: glycosyltransferase family 4 protein [Gemmataceae bacterium]|nr:glycosyltransferase family 4 protein [Gemmataceae bacterium]
MRIAHFIHRYPPAVGGAEAYFARLSAHLAAHGHEVHVFTSDALDLEAFWDKRGRRSPPGTETTDGVAVHRLPLWHFPLGHRYLMKLLSLLPWGRAWTKPFNPVVPGMRRVRERFDLVHAGCFPYSYPLMAARGLARRLGVPFFLTPFVHTGDPRGAYTTPELLALARSADRVFVQTEGERRALPGARCVMQGMGVDPASCTGGRRAWAEGEVVIGHLANLSRAKGTIDLCLAMDRVWERGSRARLVLAGPSMPEFRRFRAGWTPKGRLSELGVLDEQGKRDFFAGLDVFALPSVSDSFGLVLPEAWANGAACVVYDAGGPPWVVRDGVDGLATPCRVEVLAEALARLVEDEELRRRMGEAGRARLGEFDWEEKLGLVEREMLTAAAPRGTIGPSPPTPGADP